MTINIVQHQDQKWSFDPRSFFDLGSGLAVKLGLLLASVTFGSSDEIY